MPADSFKPFRFRAIFISDIHMGTRGAQDRALLDLSSVKRKRSALIWSERSHRQWARHKAWHWDGTHNDVIQKLLRKTQGHEARLHPRNHDEIFAIS